MGVLPHPGLDSIQKQASFGAGWLPVSLYYTGPGRSGQEGRGTKGKAAPGRGAAFGFFKRAQISRGTTPGRSLGFWLIRISGISSSLTMVSISSSLARSSGEKRSLARSMMVFR